MLTFVSKITFFTDFNKLKIKIAIDRHLQLITDNQDIQVS